MYKVFSNERIFFLTDSIHPVIHKNNCLFYKSLNSNLENFHFLFEKIHSIEYICLIGKELDLLIKNFESFFKIIHAAGGIVENNKNEILLIERMGKWDLPKGKAEGNESMEETAIREVEEECGIKNVVLRKKIDLTLHTYVRDNEYILKKTCWYKLFYEGNKLLVPRYEEDITKAVWVGKPMLKNLLHKSNTYLSILDILAKSGMYNYR